MYVRASLSAASREKYIMAAVLDFLPIPFMVILTHGQHLVVEF